MLQPVEKRRPSNARDAEGEFEHSDALQVAPESDGVSELITQTTAFLYRQYPTILFIAGIFVALAVGYVISTPRSYTAHATMIIDSRKVQLFQQPMLSEFGLDSAAIESQVEVLKSENIALKVISEQQLTEQPEFVGSGGLLSGTLGAILGMFDLNTPPAELDQVRKAVEAFEDRLTVKRRGLTQVIEISFLSLSPETAARVTNAVVDAYVIDQLEAKFQSAKRAGAWLQERLAELREQAAIADKAVVDFKTEHNIVETDGRLMGDQQLAEVNSQLILARAQKAEAQARLDRIQQIIRTGNPDGTVADALRNEVITKLRQQLADVSARVADWTARVGPEHLAVVNLRNEMAEIRRSMLIELKRIGETYASDFEIAKAREDAIRLSLAESVSQTQTTGQAQVILRTLDSTAKAYRALYDNFLQRQMEALQQESFPISDTRLITHATPPSKKSHPKTLLILAGALLAGAACGLGVAMLREIMDRTVRTSDQVSALWGVECLAILPHFAKDPKSERGKVQESPKEMIHLLRGQKTVPVKRDSGLWYAFDKPFSRYADGLRSIKLALDLASGERDSKSSVLGVTSALPNEGKSTVAANLARLIAQTGRRVILVDCDLRNPSLSRALAPAADTGVIEVTTGRTGAYDAIWTDPDTLLDFLPTVQKTHIAQTNELLGSESMADMIKHLRSMYDYVILDLAPLAPIVDTRAAANLVDSVLFVVEWGSTKIDVINHALNKNRPVQDRLLGMVLNKVDLAVLSRFERDRGAYYNNQYYSRYGYTD